MFDKAFFYFLIHYFNMDFRNFARHNRQIVTPNSTEQPMNEKPTVMETAGQMALPLGVTWGASFLCTMYGVERPILSMLSTALPIVSLFLLYRMLTGYRRMFPTVSWLHVMRISLVSCLLAGLLTDAVQYFYFIALDNGRMLSHLAEAMQSEEYREAWKQLMPQVSLEELQQMVQSITIRNMVLQLAMFNVMLALPFSLFAALPVRAPRPQKEDEGKNEETRE